MKKKIATKALSNSLPLPQFVFAKKGKNNANTHKLYAQPFNSINKKK